MVFSNITPRERKELLDDLNATINEYAEQERQYKARYLEPKKPKPIDDGRDRQ